MKHEKMSLSEIKVKYCFPKNVKFNFCPLFWAILWFYWKFNCQIYVWRCEPKLSFSLLISITLSFFPTWVFVSQNVDKILKFCSLYGPWHFLDILNKMLQMSIVFYSYSIKITTLISIWLQLSHKGSSKLLKSFIKSIALPILSYH